MTAQEEFQSQVRSKVDELISLMESLDDRPEKISFAWYKAEPIGLRFDQVSEGVDDYEDLALMLEAMVYVAGHFGFRLTQGGMWKRFEEQFQGKGPMGKIEEQRIQEFPETWNG